MQQSGASSAVVPVAQLLQQDGQLLQLVDAALTDAARRAGEHLVCRPGCTQCCHGAFAINALDALRLRAGMAALAATAPEQAEAIAMRARLYLAEYGPAFPGDAATGILDPGEEAQVAFEEFANEAACPALNPESGFCDLYSSRPMTCRVFGPPVRQPVPEPVLALDEEEGFAVCELCFTQATPEEIAVAEMIVPHAEEQELLLALEGGLAGESDAVSGETIVAFCLVPATAS